MNRDRLLVWGALALLLLFGAWCFTVATAEAGLPTIVAPLIFSITTLVASSLIFRLGLRKRISGMLVVATTLSGIGLLGIGQGLSSRESTGFVIWLLLPTFVGLGILLENQLGIGWRFSNWHAIGLIAASIGFYILARSISIQLSGGLIINTDWMKLARETMLPSNKLNQGDLSFPWSIQFAHWRWKYA